MDTYGDNLGEKFAAKSLRQFYEKSAVDMITNKNYEGELKSGGADRLSIKTYGKPSLSTYSGSALSVETLDESEGQLILSQKKAYYFKIQSLTKFEDYCNDVEGTTMDNAAGVLDETIDAYVLGLYADAGSGNRVGVDYTDGTVEVAVTTGVVTGSSTTFTSGMAGLGFKLKGFVENLQISLRPISSLQLN